MYWRELKMMFKSKSVTAMTILLFLSSAAYADFDRRIRFDVGSEPRDVLPVDINNDNVPDLVTADYEDDSISVLLGDGDGGFKLISTHPAGDGPVSLTAADFDLDGNVDIATANELDDSVTILYGNGSGFSASPVAYAVGDSPRAIAAGTINRDNRPDLVIANTLDNNVSLLSALIGGGFAPPVNHAVGYGPVALELADVDQSGSLDLVVANRDDGTVSVLLGDAHGDFAPASDYAAGDETVALLAVDATGDGLPEIVTANQGDDTIAVLSNLGNGLFGFPVSYGTGKSPKDLVRGDFNSDNVVDLAVVSCPPGKVTIFRGDGAGGFRTGAATYFVDTQSNALAAGDFNGDLRMDLAVARTKADDISLALTKQVGSAGGFELRRGADPATIRASVATSLFEAPHDDAPGTLSDGTTYFYVVEHKGGIELALSVHKNEATDAVRLGFNDGDFNSAPVDELLSEVIVDSTDVPADGTTPAVVRVIPRDSNGAQLGTGLKLRTDGQILHPAEQAGAIKDHGNGIYSLEVVSSTPGTTVLRISVEGQALANTPVLQFVRP
jgi:hypothetical protein